MIGCMIWYTWISHFVLGLNMYCSMRFLARQTPLDLAPEHKLEIPDKVRREWEGLLSTMSSGEHWVQYKPPTGRIYILTDASIYGLAAFVWKPEDNLARHITSAEQVRLPGEINMPHLEMQAYLMALRALQASKALSADLAVTWITDCLPAGLGVYKGHSPKAECNSMVVQCCLLAREEHLQVDDVRWTEGKGNPADWGSRIGRNTDTYLPVPDFSSVPIHTKVKNLMDDVWEEE
jgi:hypothetical protein